MNRRDDQMRQFGYGGRRPYGGWGYGRRPFGGDAFFGGLLGGLAGSLLYPAYGGFNYGYYPYYPYYPSYPYPYP